MATTTENLRIEITGNSEQAKAALKAAGIGFDELSDKAKQTSSPLQNFQKNWLSITAALAGTGLLIKKGFDMTGAFQGFEQGMAALARNTGQSADMIVSKLREVSKGTISNQDIMLAANRAVALNVTKDVNQMAQLLEIARVKAKAMGTTTTQAFSDMMTGIGRASPLILDNLGIITKGWAEEASASGKAMDSQFVLNKILAQGTVELARAGAGALTNAERMQQLTATMTNMKLSLGAAFAPVFMPITEGISKILDLFTKLPDSIKVFVGVLAVSMTAALAIIKTFTNGLTLATGGWGLLISAAIAAAALIITSWDKVSEFFSLAWDGIKFGWQVTVKALEVAFWWLVKQFAVALDELVSPFTLTINKIIQGFNAITRQSIPLIKSITTTWAESADANLKIHQKELSEIKFHHEAIKKSVKAMNAAVITSAQAATPAVIAETEKMKFAFTMLLGDVGAAIAEGDWKKAMQLEVKNLGRLFDALGDAIGGGFETTLSDTGKLLKSWSNGIVAGIAGTVKLIADIFDRNRKYESDMQALSVRTMEEVELKKINLKREKIEQGYQDQIDALTKTHDAEIANWTGTEDEKSAYEAAFNAKLADIRLGLENDPDIKKAKEDALKLEQKIALAKLKIDRQKAISEVKTRWFSDKDDKEKAAINKLYDELQGLVMQSYSAAAGADFITRGPQLLMVGDNPSGHERVQVTPSERAPINGESIGGATISISNLTVQTGNAKDFIDQLLKLAERSGSRLFPRGSFA